MAQIRGFFGQLLDFSFTEFITTKIIKVLYGLAIFIAAVFTILLIIGAFSDSVASGVILLVLSPLWLLLCVTVSRLILEMVLVAFRMAEHVGYLAKQQQREC